MFDSGEIGTVSNVMIKMRWNAIQLSGYYHEIQLWVCLSATICLYCTISIVIEAVDKKGISRYLLIEDQKGQTLLD